MLSVTGIVPAEAPARAGAREAHTRAAADFAGVSTRGDLAQSGLTGQSGVTAVAPAAGLVLPAANRRFADVALTGQSAAAPTAGAAGLVLPAAGRRLADVALTRQSATAPTATAAGLVLPAAGIAD